MPSVRNRNKSSLITFLIQRGITKNANQATLYLLLLIIVMLLFTAWYYLAPSPDSDTSKETIRNSLTEEQVEALPQGAKESLGI